KGCFAYTGVLWGRSDVLLVREAVYEGSHLIIFRDPTGAPAIAEHQEIGADRMNWSPDGAHFCAHSDVFLPDGVWIGDRTGAVRQVVTLDGSPPPALPDGIGRVLGMVSTG